MTVVPQPAGASSRRTLLPVAYGGLVIVAMVAAAAGGDATLLVPLTPAAAGALPALALDGGARLIGRGVLPGSLIVRRDDGARPALIARGILALPVPLLPGCAA